MQSNLVLRNEVTKGGEYMKKINKNGFTLIELLVVVAIIAILALIALLAINPVELARRSRDSRRLSDLGTIRRGIDLALADGKSLGTEDWTTIDTATPITALDGAALDVGKYLSVVPQDPLTGVTGTTQYVKGDCTAQTGVNNNTMHYQFKSDAVTSTYELRTQLESTDNCGAVKGDGKVDAYYELGTNPGMAW